MSDDASHSQTTGGGARCDVIAEVARLAYAVDLRFVNALLDGGLLDLVSPWVSGSSDTTNKERELLLRTINALPVRRSHLRDSAFLRVLEKSVALKDIEPSRDHGSVPAIAQKMLRELRLSKQ
jgi:hypothetical protein